jgi:acyl-CoA thioesterase-1
MQPRRALFIFLVLLFPLLTGCSQPAVTRSAEAVASAGSTKQDPASVERSVDPVATPSAPRIVFLGDSLTAGYGLPKEQSVPALIQKRLENAGLPYVVVNAGVSGDTSAGGLRRLDWSLEGDVRVLVVELGANDGLRGLPIAELKRNLSEIIARAQRRRIGVLLTGMEAPPNYGAAYTAEFRQAYRDVAKQQRVAFMPFYLDGVAGIANLNIGDGIHPNAEGSRIIEQSIWQALQPLLKARDAR